MKPLAETQKKRGLVLPETVRYGIYVTWLAGSSAGAIAKSLPAFEVDGEVHQLTINQINNFLRRSPYADRHKLGDVRRRQFLGDLIILRSDLAPGMSPSSFRLKQDVGQKPLPLPLYRDATCLDEILAQHYGIVGNVRAARKALRRANEPGRDGRPQAIIRDRKSGDLYDLNAGLHTFMVNRQLYQEPDDVEFPIPMAGMARQQMVEDFIRVHELAALSRLGSPDFEPKVDGGSDGGVWLTEKQADAQRRVAVWRQKPAAYTAMTRFFIEDAEAPCDEIVEEVLLVIDALAVADGRILKRVFDQRWDLEAA